MKPITKSLTVVVAIIMLSAVSLAQDYSLKGRSALEMNFGFWGGAKASNTVSTTGVQSSAKSDGFLGSILYSRWIQEQLAVTLSAGFLAGEASSNVGLSGVSQRASAILSA
jgi:hypothetical protein